MTKREYETMIQKMEQEDPETAAGIRAFQRTLEQDMVLEWDKPKLSLVPHNPRFSQFDKYSGE